MKKVTSSDFNRDPAQWQKCAQSEPVVIVDDQGVPVLYLISSPVFDSLYQGSRTALSVEDLSAEDKDALSNADMSSEHDHLDALLEEGDNK